MRLWRKFKPVSKDRLSISYFSEKLRSRSAERSISNASDENKQSDQNSSDDGSNNPSGSKGIMVHTTYQISSVENAWVNSSRYVIFLQMCLSAKWCLTCFCRLTLPST